MAVKTDGIYKLKIKGNEYDLIDYDAQTKILGLENSLGVASGIATLGEDSLLSVNQIPSIPDTKLPLNAITKYVGNNGQTSVNITENVSAMSINVENKELKDGMVLSLTFLQNMTGNTEDATMTINYNNTGALNIKTASAGTLKNFAPANIDNIYYFVQAYTTLDVKYIERESCWLIVGNPVVLSKNSETDGYTILSDGRNRYWISGAKSNMSVSAGGCYTIYNFSENMHEKKHVIVSLNKVANTTTSYSGVWAYINNAGTQLQIDCSQNRVLYLSFYVEWED